MIKNDIIKLIFSILTKIKAELSLANETAFQKNLSFKHKEEL